MSFALSTLGILAGLAAIAGGLYALQRLRVRHREVPVVTTLFWKQAVEETRARVFVRRFRHWPAYLLFLAIGALLWLGFAQPRTSGSGEGRYVLLLDGSAGMAWQDRFAQAKKALLDDIASFDPDHTEVLFCGGTVRTLLAPGENPLVLAKRLEGLEPESAPSSLRRALVSVMHTVDKPLLDHATDEIAIHAVVYGDAPLPDGHAPVNVAIERRAFAPERQGNRGIAALGIAEAVSGRWDAVDVYIEVNGGAELESLVAVTIDGEAPPEPGGMEAEGSYWIWRDVPARGGLLTASIPADDLPLDDVAAVRLPNRTPIRVQVAAHFAQALRPVLEKDPGVVLVDVNPDVEITTVYGTPPPGHHPVLSFDVVLATQPAVAGGTLHTIQVYEPTHDAARTLRDLRRVLALAEIDGAALAEALGRPVSVGVEDSVTRTIHVAGELLEPSAGFIGSRAFPLFLAGAIRYLAGRQELRRFVAAGEPQPGAIAAHVSDGRRHDPLGLPITPPTTGDYTADGTTLAASLLTADVTAAGDAATVAQTGSAGGFDVALLVILLAFALLLVEWTLFRSGRVP